jgi:hypothetical protein
MPKISVHLEADSAEEFQALLQAFHVKPAEREHFWKDELEPAPKPGEVFTAPGGPYELAQPGVEIEQPAAEAKEPAQPRRGRPRKEKTVEPVGPAAEPAVGVVLPEPGVVHEGGHAEEAAPKAEAAPAPVKPKPMPHALPENGAATRQDLLDAFSEYVQRYGASFGFSDISQLLQKNLGDGVRKASDVPEDKLPVAIGAIKSAINDNPFNRKRDYA